MGEPFDHRPPGWIRQSRKCCVQPIHNQKVVNCLSKCQVRIFGHHTDNESLLPNSDLPWAHPMKSINNSTANSPLEEGNWVVGFFMDGHSGQFPIMMGVLPGLKQ